MHFFIFIIILSILVIVHEWGHFITAKRLGVKVEKFSVGFGKKIWSRVYGGTEFMISAIPLGGYVKMAGEERSQCTGNKEEFFSHPVGHRAAIVLMGPIINFIFAYICFYFIFMTGYPTLSATVGEVKDGYPAQYAGLKTGDKITAIDSVPIESWDQLQETIMKSDGTNPLKFFIVREGRETEIFITPKTDEIPNLFGKTEKVSVVGITPGEGEKIYKRYSPVESLSRAGGQLVNIVKMTFYGLYQVFSGKMPAKEAISGPIRIFDIISEMAELGFAYLVFITGVISANLGIFNLFPVPVLDGGHLLFLLIEKIRNRPLSLKIEENLTRAGFALLMCLVVYVFYNDINHVWGVKIKTFMNRMTTEQEND